MQFNYNDGGREAAGYKGKAGDCVVRAIAIATGNPYQQVYDDLSRLNEAAATGRKSKLTKRLKIKGNSPRNGNIKKVYHAYILSLGFTWVAQMQIGTGCNMHLKDGELPPGIIIVRLSHHLAAVINGTLNDIHDCSRQGTRCVYGYYIHH